MDINEAEAKQNSARYVMRQDEILEMKPPSNGAAANPRRTIYRKKNQKPIPCCGEETRTPK